MAGLCAAGAWRSGASTTSSSSRWSPRRAATRAGARTRSSSYPWGAHYVPIPGKAAGLVREIFTDLGVFDGRDVGRASSGARARRAAVHPRPVAGGSRAGRGPDAARSRSVRAVHGAHGRAARDGPLHDPDGRRARTRPPSARGRAVDGRVARSRGARLAVAAVDGGLRVPRRLRRPGARRLGLGRHPLLRGARRRRHGPAHVARGQRLDRASPAAASGQACRDRPASPTASSGAAARGAC